MTAAPEICQGNFVAAIVNKKRLWIVGRLAMPEPTQLICWRMSDSLEGLRRITRRC